MNINFSSKFWKNVQLKHKAARNFLPNNEAESLSEQIVSILNQGCGLTTSACDLDNPKPHRTVPSAGNIYPYEILVAARTKSNTLTIYKYNFNANKLFKYKESNIKFDDLAESLISKTNQQSDTFDFVILILNRPWASVRKYGYRGVIYSFLDCAHAATNIAHTASKITSYDPIIDTHIDSEELGKILELDKYCSVIQNIIYFPSLNQNAPSIENDRVPESLMRPAFVSNEEVEKWASLQKEGLSIPIVIEKKLSQINGMRSKYKIDSCISSSIDCRLPDRNGSIVSLLEANSKRYSANSFNKAPIKLEQLKELLCYSEYNVKRYVSKYDFRGIGLRVVAKNVTDITGIFDYCFEKKTLISVSHSLPNDDFRPACMNQELVQNAAAMIILYGPISDLLSHATIAELKEAIFSAGHIGQMLYLSAAAANVGISAIGGFDTELCRELANLSDEYDPVYVFSIGNADQNFVKYDQHFSSQYYPLAMDKLHTNQEGN
jgi:SagB-type dehydrogenase family enzyme